MDVDGGVVSVLGNKPHTVKHGVPGYRVGYMPQVKCAPCIILPYIYKIMVYVINIFSVACLKHIHMHRVTRIFRAKEHVVTVNIAGIGTLPRHDNIRNSDVLWPAP